jgi:HK97 family phage major capsid protein
MIDEQGPIGDSEKITTTTKSLTPKQLVTKSAFTRQSLIQTNPNVQNLVYEQLYKAIAEKLDKMVFAKTATAGDLDSLFVAIATASQVTAGATNGAAPSRTKLLTVLNELGKRNITGTIDWASNGSVANTLANTLNDSANTASNYIIPAVGNGDMLLGKTLYQSNNIPSDFTKGTGTGLSGIIAGDFSECVVGQWDTIQVEIDRISGADNSLIYVRSYSFWDFVIKRIEAFQAMNDIITL